MADWSASGLYDTLGVSAIDGGRFEVLCSHAGPAGSSAIELPDGSVWEVDHLDPAIPVNIQVDTDDPAGSPFLVAAFGGDGALQLADHPVQGLPAPGLEGDVDQRRSHWSRDSRMTARGGQNEPGLALGRMIVCSDLSGDPRLHPLARIAAAAEFVVTADRVPDGGLLRPALTGLVEHSSELVDDVDDEDLEHLSPALASRLASPCLRVAKIGGGFDSAFRRLGRRLDTAGRGHPSIAAARSEAFPSFDAPIALDAMSLAGSPVDQSFETPLGTDSEYLEVRRVTPTLLHVRVARQDRPRWVRVLRREGLVLLAQAPLGPEDLVEVAELVIPPDVARGDLHVQIIDAEDLSTLARRPTEVIGEAVRIGRDAARSIRLQDFSTSAARWGRCAELWDQLGDRERAALARSLANRSWRGSLVLPYLADEVAEELPTPS